MQANGLARAAVRGRLHAGAPIKSSISCNAPFSPPRSKTAHDRARHCERGALLRTAARSHRHGEPDGIDIDLHGLGRIEPRCVTRSSRSPSARRRPPCNHGDTIIRTPRAAAASRRALVVPPPAPSCRRRRRRALPHAPGGEAIATPGASPTSLRIGTFSLRRRQRKSTPSNSMRTPSRPARARILRRRCMASRAGADLFQTAAVAAKLPFRSRCFGRARGALAQVAILAASEVPTSRRSCAPQACARCKAPGRRGYALESVVR